MKHLALWAVLGTAFCFASLGFAQETSIAVPSAAQASVHAALSSPTTAADTTGPDVYEVQFFRNANTAGYGSSVVDIVDPGTNGSADLCAFIFVITPDEELSECCGCLLTPDQMLELSVNGNLTSNPATGETAHNGVIKIVAGSYNGTTCQLGAPGGPVFLAPTLRAWITSDIALAGVAGPHAIQESAFGRPDISDAELTFLNDTCIGFYKDLSGHGLCTCPAPPPD